MKSYNIWIVVFKSKCPQGLSKMGNGQNKLPFIFLCEVTPSGGSCHDGIFFISRDKPNLVSGGAEFMPKNAFFWMF